MHRDYINSALRWLIDWVIRTSGLPTAKSPEHGPQNLIGFHPADLQLPIPVGIGSCMLTICPKQEPERAGDDEKENLGVHVYMIISRLYEEFFVFSRVTSDHLRHDHLRNSCRHLRNKTTKEKKRNFAQTNEMQYNAAKQ